MIVYRTLMKNSDQIKIYHLGKFIGSYSLQDVNHFVQTSGTNMVNFNPSMDK